MFLANSNEATSHANLLQHYVRYEILWLIRAAGLFYQPAMLRKIHVGLFFVGRKTE